MGLGLACLAGCHDGAQPAGQAAEPILPPTPAEFVAGQSVYEANCATCHDTSRDGAPRLGYLPAWSRRIEQGRQTLVEHAIEGLDLMPPRGDNPELTDEEIENAVKYFLYRAELNIPAGS